MTPSMVSTTHEELGYLVSGPARAAEVAIARLLDAGLIRISREGVVSAVHQTGYGAATPVEAAILRGLHGGQPLDVVAKAAAYSTEAASLRTHLVHRGLLDGNRRPRLFPWLFMASMIVLVIAFEGMRVELFAAGGAGFVWALVLKSRDKRPLTRTGHRIAKKARPADRVGAVAVHGLRGKLNGHAVAGFFGLSTGVVAMLPGLRKNGSSSCGGSGCGSGSSCSSSDGGSSCGGGGCGGGGGD